MITKGSTLMNIKKDYKIESKDLVYLIKENNLNSEYETKITNTKNQLFNLNKFNYSIEYQILKGEKIIFVTDYNLPDSDKFYFSNAIIDLKNQKFAGTDVKINIHKNVFNNSENDPRLRGVSVQGNHNKIKLKKGIFTSCNQNEECPPWSIQASKIEHDREKKQLTYENAVLNIYDVPILYFPKFFHPDPSVNRQSGFLKPKLNNSNILGSSLTIPYYKVLSNNKDLTIAPSLFDNNTKILQTEYRQKNSYSSLVTDVGFVNNFKSNSTKKTKNLSHFFGKFDLDLKFINFSTSELSANIERVSSDTYLKIFDNFITTSKVRPENFDKLNNNLKLFLANESFNFESGVETYETLNMKSSDRYQYILPYYNFDKSISENFLSGNISFSSSGSNELNETNKLKTNLINDIVYESKEYYSDNGFKSKLNFNLKNTNITSKNSSKYKSSLQSELISLINAEITLPLQKETEKYSNFLEPKISLRINPSDMKNYTDTDNKVNINSLFLENRLGLVDTLEAGKSLTVGLNYKKEKKETLENINNYFELKLGTVFRDKEENMIPKKSTLNRKSSNLFGSIENKISDKISFNYNFSIDNNYSTFEYNDISATYSNNNLITTFGFIEESGEIGDANVFSNSLTYKFNEKNSFTFNTRRNRRLNLTEYYDLVYQYKYDCLAAGIKYNKKYYSDGDLKPSENLLFTITLFPLTNYEYDAKEFLGN